MNVEKKDQVLFVVRALPYEAAGTPIVIRNLLAHLPAEGFYVLGRRPDPAKRLRNDVKQKMFQIPILYTKGYRFWKYFSILPGLFMGLWIIYRYKITKIVGVFQDDASLILAYRLANFFPDVEFFPYLMDLYAEQKMGTVKNKVSEFQEKIFNRAKKVLVANEGMKILLDPIYPAIHIESIPIISLAKAVSNKPLQQEIKNKPFKIIFSGSVNEDRLEPLRIMAKIVSKDPRFLIKYLTSQSEQHLRNVGVFFDGFEIQFCKTPDELMFELNQADLLYLPLKFTFPESQKTQMMTCFGAKVYDYMLASVPMLIHAPNYFFNYTFFEKNHAAFLLDSLDEAAIISKLALLLKEAKNDVGQKICQQANLLANQFKGEIVADKLLIQLDVKI